ncbi:MAG: B12-binding domain-containing radical SAM protein [Holophagales bacterium]|nr:B12-binding domain-containing radical SAM protein [Holophagales bacterium]
MKVCLVGAPAVTDFDDRELAESESVRLVAHQAPLGVLTLASLARNAGHELSLVDLDALYYEYLRSPDSERRQPFSAFAARHVSAGDFDLVGFGTLCSSFPVTLRIAEQVKASHPGRPIVLGGPQASVVDRATLEAFPWVDFVVRGEADHSFLAFLDAQTRERAPYAELPGLTYREGGEVVRTPNAPLVDDLDALPLPAFDLYPRAGADAHLPLELGRGCPYACKFCATNDFFRRRFRLKSSAAMLTQMRALRDAYGVTSFSLVHDMFTVDRRKVIDFCHTLLASGDGFLWSCSARTDRVDEELLELMYEAGCRGMFFGIETGSKSLQKTIRKNLDLDQAMEHIRIADRIGVETEVSLISGFAEETRGDLGDTLAFFMDSMRLRHADGNIGLLAPLAGTPIEVAHRHDLVLDDFHSDVSFQGWRQNRSDRQMILAHPEIFPNFYAVPMQHLERRFVHEVRELAVRGIEWFRRLLLFLHHDSGDLLSVVDDWLAWREEHGAGDPAEDAHIPYHVRPQFRDEFLAFVEQRYLPERASASDILRALLRYEHTFRGVQPVPEGEERARPVLRGASIPQPVAGIRWMRFPVPVPELDRALRGDLALDTLERQDVLLATAPSQPNRVRQLSPMLGDLLLACDGRGTVAELASGLQEGSASQGKAKGNLPEGVSALDACRFGLLTLWKQGFITDSSLREAA